MTALLERPAPPPPHAAAPVPSRLARWWGGWRVALRLARRDSWRGRGRALLVVLLIALPVATVSGVIVYSAAEQAENSQARQALLSLGTEADARVMLGPGQVVQAPALTSWTTTGDAPSSPDALRAALPAGSRAVSTGTSASVVVESGPWGVQSAISVQDVRDPLNAGRWTVSAGRLPQSATEVALLGRDLRRLQAGIGSSVTLSTTVGESATRTLTVVGAIDRSSQGGGVVLPGVLPGDPGISDATELLVDSPSPWTWTDVRRLNAIGAVVAARGTIESPPPFCAADQLCLDAGPAPDDSVPSVPSDLQVAEAARVAALGAVVLVLVVLQVALLAGPAFAVQLRRRQRELGLVGASGGDAAALRRTVLASGVVLGAVGATLGVALGWGAVWLVGVPLASVEIVQEGRMPQGVPPLPWYVVAVALIGVVSAMTAALIPAVMAGRGDVIDTLRGRRPLPPVRTRTPVVGLLLGAVGVALLLYGRGAGGFSTDPLILGVGLIAGELALVLVMP